MITAIQNDPVFILARFGASKATATPRYRLLRTDETEYATWSQIGVVNLGGGDFGVSYNFALPLEGIFEWDTNDAPLRVVRDSFEVHPSAFVMEVPGPAGTGARGNVAKFLRLLLRDGSAATYHREAGAVVCPCRTSLGYRDLKWHKDNPGAPVCNEQGFVTVNVTQVGVRAFVQPVQAGAVRRLTTEYVQQLFGEVQTDDHLGIFPLSWGGVPLNFYDWSQAGEDFVLYDQRRYVVVSANKIPDPSGGGLHHWEVGLRLVKLARPSG